ncbi:FKBP-type peptidyl-prolyl cis-trans isomerase [Rapidithrix thailandica]|uniref:Peptidyl-prolyl cis-trans isomerase n=1 Tax=Rapidithrix thailandica TaxID=413964 RepID=A0AAW9S9A0_9BACT
MNVKFLSILALLFSVLCFSACDEDDEFNFEEQSQRDDFIIREYLNENNIQASKSELGVYMEVLQGPGGAAPEATDLVKVHYAGKVLNGHQFDNSYYREEPFEFQAGSGLIVSKYNDDDEPQFSGSVIPGWIEAIRLMKQGEKARFYIPSGLGYGQQGQTTQQGVRVIPSNAVLVFEIELLSIKSL